MTPPMTPAAESSPAITERTTLLIPEGDARAEFMKTGVMPESKAAPTPAKETPAKGEQPTEKTAPASEPGKPQDKTKSAAALRLDELLDDMKREGITPNEIKEFRKHYQRVQAEPVKPAPEQTAKPADPKAPVRPKPEDFEGKTWAEYEAAKDKYSEDMADYKARKAIDDYRTQQAEETANQAMKSRLDEAVTRYGETAKNTITETANTIFTDAKIDGVVKALANDSPVFLDLMYTIGQTPEALKDFLDTAHANPGHAVRNLVLIEKLVMEELAKGSKADDAARGEDGKFKAPEPKTTKAPPPPTELGGRGAPSPDEVESAYQRASKSGDARSFIEAENAREIRRRKGL